jgi:hypothetical protein
MFYDLYSILTYLLTLPRITITFQDGASIILTSEFRTVDNYMKVITFS